MRILRISFVVLSFLLAGNIFGQLVVTNTGMTPQQLVQNILVGGGVTVTNVTFLGQLPQQIGRFSTGVNPTNLGMTTGIILSSGDVTLAPGPNNSASSGANTSSGSDPDLEMLIPGYSVNDKGVLEFDFIPLSDTIRFNYIFASEEYPEFVNTSFNDVFGFFLSGPGITGPYSNNAVNIAIIPGTALPVTIDNVNMGNFSCGGSPTGCTNCVYYVNNCGGATIQYDGFTTKLTAWRIVQPCQVYHIKIAVADAGDSAYDSAVFLEAGSFISNGITSQVTYTSTIDTTAIRGCSQGLVTFSIPEQLSTNTVINYQIGGTAQNGVDYTTIGNSVIIPAGQTTGTILINPLIGTGNAPIETVYIITSVSPCQSDTIKIYIRDYQPVVLTASNDTAICQGASAPIHVNVTGGITPYTYAWSGGGNTSNITVTPSSTTMYTVTVNDACQSYNEYVNITVNLNPTTPFTAPPVCASVEPGAINLATITWTGTAEAGATYTWSLSGNPQPQSIFSGPGPINNVYWIWDNTPNTNYYNITLTITNPSGCTSTTTNQIAVVPANNPNCCIPPTLNAGPDISVCGYNYTFNASISGGSIGTWSQLSGAGTSSFSDEHNTTAIVTVTTFGQYTFHWYGESGACNSSDDIVVNFLQYPNPVAGIDELICGTSYTLQGNLPGGMTGTWTCTSPGVNFSNIHAANSSVTVPVPGEYQFVWTLDNTVCSAEDAVTINFFAIPNPNAGPDATVCGNTVNLTGTPNGTTFLGQWTGPNGTLYTPNDTTPNVTAMILPFTVQQNITFQWHQSNEHCSDSDAVVITFNPYAGPGQVSAGFHGYTCDSTIQLHGIIQGVVGTGQWSTTFSNVIIADNLDANTYISINPSTTNYGDSSQYTVTMLWTVSNGNCVARDSVNVTFYETPNASAGKDVAFCGLSGYLPGRFTISAHAGEWTLLIPPAPGCSNTYFSDNTDPTTAIQVSCYGVYTFMWRERNLYNNLCSTTDTVQIEFVELPTISGGDDQWVCGDTVYLHALPSGSSAGQTWSTSPVTWYNSITHQADTTAQQDPVTIAQHYHTFNDTVNFVWQEYNFPTIATTPQCASKDTVHVYFFVWYPAIEYVDSQWDTVQCGRNYGGLNSEIPPEGHGYWVDNLGTTDFYPPAPDNYNVDSAVVESYGLHIFYWVVRNGIRPNGTSVCVDSSDAVPIRFIEIPVANAGGNAHNWGNGSEIKTDTACGLEYALDPYITGSPVGQWQTTGWPNRGFVSTNSNTSGMANDTAFSTIYNSDNPLNPYYEFIWQVDNSVIDAPPYSHGCIDRDTLRITFARIPTGQIESRNPYCYGDTALLTPWFDPNGKPDHFTWNFNNGAIESVRPNPSTNQFDSIFMVSWDTTGHTMYHIVSLVSTNSWGCYSNIVTDTIFEPAPLYPLDSIVPTTCMQANGKIFVFPIDLLSTTYFWLDPEFASNPTALFQIDLPPDHPYHIRFRYESWSPNIFCNDTLIILIPDTGKVTASYDTAVLHQEHLIPGYSELFFTNTSVGGKRYEWHFGDGSTSTAENPSHIYTSLEKSDKGCFHVYLIAWSKEECEDWSDSGLVCLESVSELIVPNIFSPNGDEKNDYFQVSGKTLKSFHGIITNRWGKTLYEWDEWDKELYPTSGWDGKIKSNEASPGVYYYIIKAEGWDDIKYDLKGAFHLVREK